MIDGGCTLVRGLRERCDCFLSVNGPGKVYRHPEGLWIVHDDGYKVLVKLDGIELWNGNETAALRLEVERLRKALETVIDDLEGYEDGAPDASVFSKTVNVVLARIRAVGPRLAELPPRTP